MKVEFYIHYTSPTLDMVKDLFNNPEIDPEPWLNLYIHIDSKVFKTHFCEDKYIHCHLNELIFNKNTSYDFIDVFLKHYTGKFNSDQLKMIEPYIRDGLTSELLEIFNHMYEIKARII